jgi:chromosome segregation ATPase
MTDWYPGIDIDMRIKKVEKLEADLAAARAEVEFVRGERDSARATYDELQHEAHDLRADVARLQERVEELEDRDFDWRQACVPNCHDYDPTGWTPSKLDTHLRALESKLNTAREALREIRRPLNGDDEYTWIVGQIDTALAAIDARLGEGEPTP